MYLQEGLCEGQSSAGKSSYCSCCLHLLAPYRRRNHLCSERYLWWSEHKFLASGCSGLAQCITSTDIAFWLKHFALSADAAPHCSPPIISVPCCFEPWGTQLLTLAVRRADHLLLLHKCYIYNTKLCLAAHLFFFTNYFLQLEFFKAFLIIQTNHIK